MAQRLKGKLVNGPYKPIQRNCAIYLLSIVPYSKALVGLIIWWHLLTLKSEHVECLKMGGGLVNCCSCIIRKTDDRHMIFDMTYYYYLDEGFQRIFWCSPLLREMVQVDPIWLTFLKGLKPPPRYTLTFWFCTVHSCFPCISKLRGKRTVNLRTAFIGENVGTTWKMYVSILVKHFLA